ncbi:MAG: PKD domain-containing protein [Flavobacteriales bacterium]|nr:PKD domain-containing protein [Flavobacteriales bacterium]
MKKIDFRIILITLLSVIFINGASAQCTASFTYTDMGNGVIGFTNTSIFPDSNIYAVWEMGDAGYATGDNPIQTFYNGWHQICLTINDTIFGGSCTSTICDSIEVTSGVSQPLDSCTIQVSYTVNDMGNGVYSFTSTVTDGIPNYQYYWQFGDGGIDYSANPVHTYLYNGALDICLTVIDADSCSNVYCDSLIVTNATGGNSCNIVSDFTYSDNGNGNYSFVNTTTGIAAVSIWNFGDGTTSNSFNPNHTFLANGVYTVVLASADSNNMCVDYYTLTINVTGVVNSLPCNAGFTIYTDSTYNGVYVINSSTGSNLTCFWDFGDGNTSTQAYPNYTYSTAGPFELCLTVTGDSSCTSTYCDSIGAGGIVLKQNGFDIKVVSPTTVGINDEVEFISALEIYPNPVKNKLTIDLGITKQSNVEVFVTDLLGKTIAQIANEEVNVGNTKFQWNTSNTKNGIYLLNIISNKSRQVKKIVVNR